MHREAGCRNGAASFGFLVASVTRTRGPCRSTGVSVAAETLEAAYRRHSDELIRYATVLVGPDDASDVVTDAMVRVFASTCRQFPTSERSCSARCITVRSITGGPVLAGVVAKRRTTRNGPM